MARAALLEPLHEQLRQVDETTHVGLEHDVDLIRRDIAHLVHAIHQPGIVHQHVHVTRPVRQARDQRVQLVPLSHVHGERGVLAAVPRTPLLVRLLTLLADTGEHVRPARGQHDVRAGLRKQLCRSSANAATRAGHEHHLVVQPSSVEQRCHGPIERTRGTRTSHRPPVT